MTYQIQTEEAKTICENCKKKMLEKYPDMINCAFRNDNEYCDRIEDIDLLTWKLYKLDKMYCEFCKKEVPYTILDNGRFVCNCCNRYISSRM